MDVNDPFAFCPYCGKSYAVQGINLPMLFEKERCRSRTTDLFLLASFVVFVAFLVQNLFFSEMTDILPLLGVLNQWIRNGVHVLAVMGLWIVAFLAVSLFVSIRLRKKFPES